MGSIKEQAAIGSPGLGDLGPSGPASVRPPGLFLVGTVHGDPAGYRRAWRILGHLAPQVITVEISPFSVRYRKRAARIWQRRLAAALDRLPPGAGDHVALARVAAQVALPFEYRVARDWSALYRVPVKLVDSGGPARVHLPRFYRELLTWENLARLLDTPAAGSLEDYVKAEFHRARRALRGEFFPWFRPRPPENDRRERLMARRLRHLAHKNLRVVHLGGWEHLLPWPDGRGLPQLLADLKPRVVLLDGADALPLKEPPL